MSLICKKEIKGGDELLNLVEKARKGDDQAFLDLFQNYEEEIYKIAFIYVKNQNDALDIVQETAYRSFKTWLIKIAINSSLDLIRKQNKITLQEPSIERESKEEAIEEQVLLKMTVLDLMEQLNEDEKTIIILKYYKDYTIKDISKIRNIPLSTAKTILYRALKKLRKNRDGADINE